MFSAVRRSDVGLVVLGFLLAHVLWPGVAGAQTLPTEPKKTEAKSKGADSRDGEGKKAASAASKLANVDRIARLQTFIQQDQELRDKLKALADKLTEDIRAIGGEIAGLDTSLKSKSAELAKIGDNGTADAVFSLQGDIADLTTQKEIATERLGLTIKERKVLQERIGGIEQKLLQNQLMLDMLMGDGGDPAGDARVDPRVKQAREEARLKELKAKDAELETKSLGDRIKAMEAYAELEKGLLDTDQKTLDLTLKQTKTLEEERVKRLARMAPAADIDALDLQLDVLTKRREEIRSKMTERTERLARIERELTTARKEKELADAEAARKKLEADRAQATVDSLENPFNPQNILRWIVNHGPRLLLILLGMLALRYVVRSMDNRLVQFMVNRSSKGRPEERENRARTLAGVFHNFMMILVLSGGCLMILEEIGIPIIPLMGGAAILGLAVAFGAQNLIKDYFYGFVILMENQYTVNDVVRIGSTTGTVERISLRMTVLRDLEGVVHFIPHGQVACVSNLTHGWSRASFDISIAYDENVDRVMEVLLQVGRELRRDPLWDELILEDPEMLGVDQFSDSAVVIKFLIKTRPLQKWKVKREMMRRIKKTFDAMGIQIPFPQRVVHHKYEVQEPRAQDARPDLRDVA